MGALARVYLSWQRGEDPEHPPWSWPLIFWTALAGGILLKGPLILMFVVLTIGTLAILDRSAAWLWRLRPVWGLMWMLVLVLPGSSRSSGAREIRFSPTPSAATC
jgi:4-amino-4-deoxy-L-arabinose transferase-like glycosyltransferase